jgi:hypothetical protein
LERGGGKFSEGRRQAATRKAKGKSKKAKVRTRFARAELSSLQAPPPFLLPFYFCLFTFAEGGLPFAFLLLPYYNPPANQTQKF